MTGSRGAGWFIGALLFLLVIGVVGVWWTRKCHSRLEMYLSSAFHFPADGYTEPPPPRTYTTTFPNTENPISEGHNWVSGSTVRSTPGLAFGTQTGALPPPYTDSTALLMGTWGNDQFVQIVVWWDGAPGTNSDYDEVEIRLRGTLAKNWSRTYNINCRVGTPSADSYIQMGRGNGPPDDFTPPIAELHGTRAACQNGDVITGTIVGSVITAYINGKKVIQGMDSAITSGAPGFGFFHQGTHAQNSDFGISSFTAADRFPRFPVRGQVESPTRPKSDVLRSRGTEARGFTGPIRSSSSSCAASKQTEMNRTDHDLLKAFPRTVRSRGLLRGYYFERRDASLTQAVSLRELKR